MNPESIHTFASRVLAERRSLAVNDPEGELEAVHPLLADTDAWSAGLAASHARAEAHLTSQQAEMVSLIKSVQSERLGAYLEAVRTFLTRYVAFPSVHEAIAIALWVSHAFYVEQFETSPLLAITSAEMRSGKTRLLDCLELMVPHPFRVVTPSEAVVYTVLAQAPRPTMLLDEADAIFGTRLAEKYEGLRAILNAGNRKGTPVLRVKLEGRRRLVDRFDVYGPKAIAGIGKLPDTVTDRSIRIRLKRRAPGEIVAKFRRRIAGAEAESLGAGPPPLGTLVSDVPVPDELDDRAADSWEPLLAIADAAGGMWPHRARLAAIALSSEDDSPASLGVRLLADVREVFDDRDHLSTADLLAELHDLEDAPWVEYYGKPLSARGLAKLLEPYRVIPAQRRIGREKLRGYFAADFTDAWARYAPLTASSPEGPTTVRETGTSGTSGTPYQDRQILDPPALPVRPPRAPGEQVARHVECKAYSEHQTSHRLTAGSWICVRCAAPLAE